MPINPPKVGMYTCGPTVYDYTHIGHARTYIFADLLRRSLEYLGYQVTHVMNVTDVGHLVLDADVGEDKIEKASREQGKRPEDLARFYTQDFFAVEEKLNILRPHIVCKATDHIPEMIALVQLLEEKGFLYELDDGLYFDISKFPNYGKLGGFTVDKQKPGARVPVRTKKRHPADFAVWKKAHSHHLQQWDSPWGRSFPGWHVECSVMSMKYLGEQFDIHTGGEDHIQVHHNNEIAQSEAATGRTPFVRYWMHAGHLLVNGKKMAKSLKNFFRLTDLEERGFDAIAYRYLTLTAHYRSRLNFSWKGLEGAAEALKRLSEAMTQFRNDRERTALSSDKLDKIDMLRKKFVQAISDDLSMPEALSVVWEVVKTNIPGYDKYDLLLDFDQVLGLGLNKISNFKLQITNEVQKLIDEREKLRKEKKFAEADRIRLEIEKKGFAVEDTKEGPNIRKI